MEPSLLRAIFLISSLTIFRWEASVQIYYSVLADLEASNVAFFGTTPQLNAVCLYLLLGQYFVNNSQYIFLYFRLVAKYLTVSLYGILLFNSTA